MDFWINQAFNGISYGALLFLFASGLSLIFGVMRIVNFAHGSYYLMAGYLGLTLMRMKRPIFWRSWAAAYHCPFRNLYGEGLSPQALRQ